MHKRILAGIMAAVLMLSNPVFVQNVSATEQSAQEQNVEEQSEETQTGEQQEEQGEETSKTEEISEGSKEEVKEEQEVQNEEIKEDKELIEEQKKDNSKLEVQPKSTEDETQPQSKTQKKKTESKKEKTDKEEKKQTENLQEQVENDISVQGTDSFGELFADAVGAEVESQEKNNGYNIFSVEMKDKTATVSFETLKDATLVVGIYEEDGIKMLASGKTAVKKGEQAASVTIDISAMPNYYYVKAFLIESDSFKPLCTSYESPNYTREMQEFFKKTVDDFSEKEVLNLDEDKANNFAVYRDETKIIAHSQDVNQLALEDNENNLYRIENADDTVTSLKAGDIFSYTKDDGSVLIVKIAQITVDGTTVNITGTKTSIEETFEYVKIDCEAGTEEATVNASDLEEGVVYNGIVDDAEASGTGSDVEALGADIEAKETKSLSHSFVDKKVGSDNANIKLSGSLNLKVESSVKLYATLNYQYLEVRMDYSARIGITLSGQAATKIPLVTITYHPVPGVYIELKPSFVLEAKAKAELSGTIAGVVGFNVSNNEGMKNITNAPTFTPKLGGEASVYLGFSLEPHIGIISESVADVGLNAELGAETTAKLIHTDTAKRDENKKHDCKNCIKGDINGKLKLGFKASLLNSNKLTFTYNDEKTLKIADYYYSMDYHQGGLSTCPHWSYRIIVTVQGKDGVPLSGAKINQQYTTDGAGMAVFYLPSGKHTLNVEAGGYLEKQECIEVTDDAKCIWIDMAGKNNSGAVVLGKVKEVSQGYSHTGAITEDGSLYMWGSNSNRQIGDGTSTTRTMPVKIMDDVKSVSLGNGHSAAIKNNGDLYTWGNNCCGQLGDGTTSTRTRPVKIMAHVKSVRLYSEFSGAITEDGSLYMWGHNGWGQVGNGTTTDVTKPVKVLENVKSLTINSYHVGAITEDGSLYMWGRNDYGQVGNGSLEVTKVKKPVKVLDNVESVSMGNSHTGAVTKDGSFYMWGINGFGQLGEAGGGYITKPKENLLGEIQSVSMGYNYTGAVTKDGSLYMWGYNREGQLGYQYKGTSYEYIPTKILDGVKSVMLGTFTGSAIMKDGSLYMWGYNGNGQVGNGTTTNVTKPTKILDQVKKIRVHKYYTSSNGHTAAITEDGSLYMWGSNSSGQLGDGTTTDRLTPVKINDPAAGANGTPQSSIDTVQPLGTADNTATYQNLKPNETYLFYAVKSETEDDILKASNLLCLTEATSDADGNMSVPYALRESCEDPIFFVRSLSKTDLASAQVKAEDLSYNKKEQSIAPEVTFDGKILTPGVDYEVSGDITATDIGTYKIKITGIGEYTGSVEASYKVVCRHSYGKDWTIDKEATCTAEGRKSRYCTLCGAQADVTTIAKKAHEYQTATTKATTKADGKIVKSCKHCGQTTTTVIAHPKSVALKQTSYTYNKKNRKPSVTIEDTKGNKLKSGTDYTVSYPKKCKNVGRYTVTVKFKGNYQGTVKKSYQILPKGTSLSEVTAKKKGFTAKWKKQKTQTAGYELQYSTNKKFKRKQTKKAVIKKTKTTTYKAKKLKANKKYYIRIRTYQNVKVNGKTKKLYSSWSKAKSIKTKK